MIISVSTISVMLSRSTHVLSVPPTKSQLKVQHYETHHMIITKIFVTMEFKTIHIISKLIFIEGEIKLR